MPGTWIPDTSGSVRSGSRGPGYGAPLGGNDVQRHHLLCDRPLGGWSQACRHLHCGGAGEGVERGWGHWKRVEEDRSLGGASDASQCHRTLDRSVLLLQSWTLVHCVLVENPLAFRGHARLIHPSLPAPLSAPGLPCLACCTLGSLGSQLHASFSHSHAKTPPLFLSQSLSRAPERHFQLPLPPSTGKTHRSSEAATGGRACLASCLTAHPSLLSRGSPAPPFWNQESQPRAFSPFPLLAPALITPGLDYF